MKQTKRLAALLLAACLCLAGCGGKADGSRATTMRLEKASGQVSVWDEQKETIERQEKQPLYSGYSVHTGAESYGWINLDDTKLAKLDEASVASVQQDGRRLQLDLEQGNLFFQVTNPLEEGETMEIRASDMIVGIRGTCGWIQNSSVLYVLEGTVSCEFASEGLSAQVSAGEKAFLVRSTENRIGIEPFTQAEIPDYVRAEIEEAMLRSVPETLEPEPEEPPAAPVRDPDSSIYTLPMTGEEFQSLPSGSPEEPIVIRAGEGDNTLVLDRFSSIRGYVIVEDGITVTVADGSQVNIDGTLEVRSDLVNDGFILIGEDGLLQVDGAFTSTGMLCNGDVGKATGDGPVETQNSRIVAAQGIVSSGYFENTGTVEGTVTVNGGTASLMAGSVDKLILNDGLYIDDGGACGEFVQNGGKTTSAAEGYRY